MVRAGLYGKSSVKTILIPGIGIVVDSNCEIGNNLFLVVHRFPPPTPFTDTCYLKPDICFFCMMASDQ